MADFTIQVFGDNAPLVAMIADKTTLVNISDPLNPVPVDYDWFADGKYTTDGELLDGSNDVDGNPRPSLKYYEYRSEENGVPTGFVNVLINGSDTLANGIPFRASGTQRKAATLVRGAPQVKNAAFEIAWVFRLPNGRSVIKKYTEAIE